MPKKLIVFAVLATALAALFVRLGFWQLSRHQERKEFNARRTIRQIVLEGTPDTANQFVISGRSRNGTPGVHVITPYRMAGNDTGVLVNRGWVYAPDAATADLSRYREELTTIRGYADSIPAGPGLVDSARHRTLRRLTTGGVRALMPYPVAAEYVISQDSAGVDTPARLPGPRISNGPHLGYAVQWFSFALIGLAGTGIVLARGRTGRAGSTAASTRSGER